MFNGALVELNSPVCRVEREGGKFAAAAQSTSSPPSGANRRIDVACSYRGLLD